MKVALEPVPGFVGRSPVGEERGPFAESSCPKSEDDGDGVVPVTENVASTDLSPSIVRGRRRPQNSHRSNW